MAATIDSAIIHVTTTASQLASVVSKLTESNLTVESSHKYEGYEDDCFAINGYDNKDEDDSSDEESNDGDEESNADQHQYLITLPIFDALAAVVLLKGAEVVDGGMMHLISNVKFAYNKQFGYKIGNDNNARLSYWQLGGNFFQMMFRQKIPPSTKSTSLILNPGRSPFQNKDDDIIRAVGIMLAIYRVHTKGQLNTSVTKDMLKSTINAIPTEFFHIAEHGYTSQKWTTIRNFYTTYTTEGLSILEILNESINAIDDLSTSSVNQEVDLLAGLMVKDPLTLLKEFDETDFFGDIMAAATTPSNTTANIDSAKEPYGKMIGVTKRQISRSIATIPSLIDADNVEANFIVQNDAAIYTTTGNKKKSSHHNLFDTVPNLNYKSHAIDLLIRKCASKKIWSSFMVARGIKEILDHGETGQLWLFTQDEDLANGVYYSATIMDRDDIENESDSKNIMNSRGKIYGVYEYYMKRNAAATEAEEESDT